MGKCHRPRMGARDGPAATAGQRGAARATRRGLRHPPCDPAEPACPPAQHMRSGAATRAWTRQVRPQQSAASACCRCGRAARVAGPQATGLPEREGARRVAPSAHALRGRGRRASTGLGRSQLGGPSAARAHVGFAGRQASRRVAAGGRARAGGRAPRLPGPGARWRHQPAPGASGQVLLWARAWPHAAGLRPPAVHQWGVARSIPPAGGGQGTGAGEGRRGRGPRMGGGRAWAGAAHGRGPRMGWRASGARTGRAGRASWGGVRS
jgi:hypothetical protein